jgi:hypothetical protein
MSDVVYYKDSLLDAPTPLSTKTSYSSPVTGINRAGSASPTASHGGTIDSYATWTPPALWSQPDPAGPPSHGHIHFTLSTAIAPAYSIV